MKLTERIRLVGRSLQGFGLTHNGDCHDYLENCGPSVALIDSGVGMSF